MPIYMDRHNLDSVTAKDVAEVHLKDIKIQDEYHCKGLTYWFDEERRAAFCLVEAPNEESVKSMHDHAHGLIPHQIIEVERNVVSAFLGRITDPQSEPFLENTRQPIISETAYRIIMYIAMDNVVILKSLLGQKKALKIINDIRDAIQRSLKRHSGREVIKDTNKLIASFISAEKAISCAREVQRGLLALDPQSEPIDIRISITAGMPVTDQKTLFGTTVQLAERFCAVARGKQILIASAVKEVYGNENLDDLFNEPNIHFLSPDDEDFITRLVETTASIWNDPTYDVGVFGHRLGLSRSQFYRKISGITGLSPNEFIKSFKLKNALKLIETKNGNIAQIAFETGFNNPSYFSKCFVNQYGILPSSLAAKLD